MLATDLGRKLWSLSLDGRGGALWLDYRRDEYCRSSAVDELRFLPLADLPLDALPRLLLGRLPAEPAADLRRSDDAISYLDAVGKLWSGSFAGGGVAWWSLMEDGEAVIWWRREQRGGVFSHPREEREVRWEEIVREELAGPLAGPKIPPGYRQGECVDGAAR